MVEKEQIGLQLRVAVDYSKAGVTVRQEYRFSGGDVAGQLAARAKDQIDQLTAIDTAAAAIKVGPITIPTPPTSDPARDAFLTALRLFTSTKKACDLGLLDVTGPEMTQAAADLKNKFRIEYLDLL